MQPGRLPGGRGFPIDTIAPDLPHDRSQTELDRALLEKIGALSPDLIYAKDRAGRMIFANPALLAATGRTWSAIKGRSELEWHQDKEEARRIAQSDAQVIATGVIATVEETLTGPAGRRIYLATKGPLTDNHGATVGVFGIATDITARKAAEDHTNFLMDEMRHRVKNTLAIVQAMARQTLKMSGGNRAAWDAFEARLVAMSRAHDVLTSEHYIAADVGVIVAEALTVHGAALGARFNVDGPEVMLDAQTALALAMALHELGTNALKYGALSVEGGRVVVRWAVENDARGRVFDLRWSEHGGPLLLEPPSHRGFGSKLIEQAFSQHDVDYARIEYLAQGVEFRLRLVLPPVKVV